MSDNYWLVSAITTGVRNCDSWLIPEWLGDKGINRIFTDAIPTTFFLTAGEDKTSTSDLQAFSDSIRNCINCCASTCAAASDDHETGDRNSKFPVQELIPEALSSQSQIQMYLE